MPKASLQLAIARQWEMLKKLPSRGPGITAAQLTAFLQDEKGFAVSKRTVERDLIELARLFGIRCNERSIPYGWHWLPGQQCDFTSIDLADAVSLVLAESILRKPLPAAMLAALSPKFELARSKLATLENHHLRDFGPTAAPSRDPRNRGPILSDERSDRAAELTGLLLSSSVRQSAGASSEAPAASFYLTASTVIFKTVRYRDVHAVARTLDQIGVDNAY